MLLRVDNLVVSYGAIQALHGISFEVEEGEIVTLIGANGAGKSTTLWSIVRQINEMGGDVVFVWGICGFLRGAPIEIHPRLSMPVSSVPSSANSPVTA